MCRNAVTRSRWSMGLGCDSCQRLLGSNPTLASALYSVSVWGRRVHIYPFRWSGRNGFKARARASVALAEHLARVATEDPDAHHYVIAHSHGGNVLARALSTSKLADKVAGTVCLSTPFLAISQRQFGAFLRTNLVIGGLIWSYVLGGFVSYEKDASPGTAQILDFRSTTHSHRGLGDP